MKGMKKLLSILMVLTLVLSLGVSAFASPAAEHTTTVTIGDPKAADGTSVKHDYVAYQIFKGTQAEDKGDYNKLASIEWADGFNATNFLSALKSDTTLSSTFSACNTADDVANAVATLAGNKAALRQFGKLAAANAGSTKTASVSDGGSVELPEGYYVIIDTTEKLDDSVRNDIVLVVVGDEITVQFKADVPSNEKKVKDKNDQTGDTTDWQKTADWDIGDKVPFQLSATIPAGTTAPFTDPAHPYKLVFHDKECDGLTFDSTSVKVYVNGSTSPVDSSLYTITYDATKKQDDGCTFEITIPDVTKLSGFEDSRVGGNTITVEYESTLNDKANIGVAGNKNTMDLEFSNDYNSEGTGKTPEKTVIVFTYKMESKKIDDENNDLAGANFALLKKVASPTSADKATWQQLGEKADKSFVEYEGAIYQIIASHANVGTDTTFKFEGIDDGEYLLVETKVPDGYNRADDIKFTVEATHNEESQTLTDFVVKDKDNQEIRSDTEDGAFTVSMEQGSVSNTVVNKEGIELPETGGIGTTIFYIAGAVLVIGAMILLVTKKRVSGMEK